eukprot:m.145291 g.145291  ORF g.145291 m.145291 type:complete len:115 (+) comp38415_c0_seq6:156-500(+)
MPRTKCKSADQRRLQSRRIKRESRARKLNCATTSDAERPRTECGRGDACIKPCWTEEDLKMNSGFIKEVCDVKRPEEFSVGDWETLLKNFCYCCVRVLIVVLLSLLPRKKRREM